MPRKSPIFYFIVTVTLVSLQLCNGHAVDSEVGVQRPSAAGSVHFRSVVSDVGHKSVASVRRGSLAFKFHGQRHQNSTPVFHNLIGAKLKRLDPSVQCSDNWMTLKVRGVRAPRFLVDSGEGRFIPLSQMPPKCGFSVKRSRRDVRFAAPYQGCHVAQQGGDYVLPLHLWGAPMTLSCPAVLPPTVSCFPSGMVLKISGITANQLNVKVSGTWKSLSMVCSSCGIAVEVLPGGLTLTAPYNRGLCIETKGEEYLLTLLLADVELSVTCPSLPDTKPTTTTRPATITTPPRESGQSQQYPQYPKFPMFPQYPVVPEPTPPPLLPMGTQHPQLPSDSNIENQEAPPAEHDALPFMPQFLQYPLFPKPVQPKQPTATNENTAAPLAQLPQMPQSPEYPFLFFPQFPMAPGIFHPTTPPPPATGTEASVTTPATSAKHDVCCVHQQPQLLMPAQYPLLPLPEPSPPPAGQSQAVQDPKHLMQKPKPNPVYPQTYQIPVLYPPPKYPSQRQNTHTAAPTTTSTTTTLKPAAQKQFYYPHPNMPAYYVPPHAPMPVFPDPLGAPPANSAPSEEQKHQPSYRAMPPFYYYPSHQRPKRAARHE